MSEERAQYLATASGNPPDRERLDLIRGILGDEATWSEPPPEVGDHLIAAIATAPMAVTPTPSRQRWPMAAAAILGVAAVVILVAGLLGVFSDPSQQVVAIEGTELEPGASGQAWIRETDAGWWVRLDVEALPAAAEGTYYEGWVWNDDGAGVSIGTFHLRGGDEEVILWSGVDPANYPAIWVTLEDEDGDPSASERIVMWGHLDES